MTLVGFVSLFCITVHIIYLRCSARGGSTKVTKLMKVTAVCPPSRLSRPTRRHLGECPSEPGELRNLHKGGLSLKERLAEPPLETGNWIQISKVFGQHCMQLRVAANA